MWRHYVLRLQYLYEVFALTTLYGSQSEQSNTWLADVVPKLQAEVEKMPEDSRKGDWGLLYMIESMAVGLVEAAKQMGADSLHGMLSTSNTEPKLAMSVMSSKKRSLADEDMLDVAADSEVALRTFKGLIHGGAKKPRIHQPVVPAFAFTAKGWVDPKVNRLKQTS